MPVFVRRYRVRALRAAVNYKRFAIGKFKLKRRALMRLKRATDWLQYLGALQF